eukprot:TRINITY_DN15614_c0_g1_i1.p1 TRINITY_DN15614_c0_g1~~TRINITY_DN15614_c0_g1_i1.p1  ORF type:complete len:121 (+),score=2.65 TRINITY_DN15614_c0_g1_i1:191-553(+)
MTTTELAWEESTLGDHLDEYLAADDNEDNISIYSTTLGGVHIYSYPPSQILNRPFWTLVTVGASGTVMPVPDRVPGTSPPTPFVHMISHLVKVNIEAGSACVLCHAHIMCALLWFSSGTN